MNISKRILLKYFLTAFFLVIVQLLSAQEFNGVWKSQGYGEILDIEGNTANVYNYTQVSNLWEDSYIITGNALGTGTDYEGDLMIVNDHLILTSIGGTVKVFTSITVLPNITELTDDPLTNFNVFWQTYEDYCALFPILDVVWNEQLSIYAPQINQNTTDQQLFDYMASMLATLNDGHSYIDDLEENYFEGGPMISDLWYEYDYDMMDLIEEEYILGQNYQYSGDEQISYGMLTGNIGYIAVNSFDDYDENGNERDDNAAFVQAIDQAFTFIQNSDALTLDVRFNLGGFDSNVRLLADRLITVSQPVYSKMARIGGYNDFADSLVFYIFRAKIGNTSREISFVILR